MPDGFAERKTEFEESPEYQPGSDNHLGLINAADAYARGATGAGETVVVADSGFYGDHRELSGKFTLGASFGGECSVAQILSRRCAGPYHGTATAGIAAARRDRDAGAATNMHGVAFDANIIGVRHRLCGSAGCGTETLPPSGVANIFEFYAVILYQSVVREVRRVASGVIERHTISAPGVVSPPPPPTLQRGDRLLNYYLSRPRGSIFSLSFGVRESVTDFTREQFRTRFGPVDRLFAQTDPRRPGELIPGADRSIIVWSAGNQEGTNPDSPTIFPGLGHLYPELQEHIVAVVSVGRNGAISGGSNRCGVAKSFCIAAPGVGLVVPTSDTDQHWRRVGAGPSSYRTSFSGTSAAAPVVSGALAVMRSFFKNPDGTYSLGNTELVARMLATANRNGIYADSDTYGHGLLDLDAATRPVGELMMATTDDGRVALGDTSLDITQRAFGGAVERALDGVPVALFDQLDTPFFRDAGQLVRQADGGGELATFAEGGARANNLLRWDAPAPGWDGTGNKRAPGFWFARAANAARPLGQLRAADDFAFNDKDAFAAPYFSLVKYGIGGGVELATANRAGFSLALMHGAAQSGEDWANGDALAFAYRPANRSFSFIGGALREGDGFLGARPGGALGVARAETLFAGVNGAWGVGRKWRALAAGYVGQTRPNATGGLLRVSDLRSSAFSLGLSRRSALRKHDWLGFRLTQPLRVESGHARLRLATARSKYGVVSYSDIPINLKPRTRALQAEAAWRTPALGGHLSLGLQLTRHPGHDPDADMGAFAWLRFERGF